MPAAISREGFLQNLCNSGLYSRQEIDSTLNELPEPQADDGKVFVEHMIAAGNLTPFQADAVRERHFDELVIGYYQILDRLGAGGMGKLYKGRHRRMGREGAVKVLSCKAGQSEASAQWFQRAVEAVARSSHLHIVMAYDADEAEVGSLPRHGVRQRPGSGHRSVGVRPPAGWGGGGTCPSGGPGTRLF